MGEDTTIEANKGFINTVLNPFKLKYYFLFNLPMALLAGIKLDELNAKSAQVSLKYKWLNTNPFKSTYFACLQMAAEFSTGIICMAYINNSPKKMSILVLENRAKFQKKAVGKLLFKCKDGDKIKQAINESVSTGEGRTVEALSIGTDESGDQIGEFYFTWTFKAKR